MDVAGRARHGAQRSEHQQEEEEQQKKDLRSPAQSLPSGTRHALLRPPRLSVKLRETQAVMDDHRRWSESLTVIWITFCVNDWNSET
jgi:hypothetical protein